MITLAQRPCTNQRLVQHVFEARRRRTHCTLGDEVRGVQDFPACNGAGPLAGNFSQRNQSRSRVLSALGVVGRRRRHAVRPLPRPRHHRPVKGFD